MYLVLLHCCTCSPGTVPPSTLIASPADGHDYETQESWDESPPDNSYPHYQSGDPVGSSEDDDDEEEEDPLYEPVRKIEVCI